MPRERVFLDSGAFSLAGKARKKLHVSEKAFYKTDTFWNYVDAYAAFIKENEECFDHYANVDTSRFPSITWDVQKYLEEEHGLKPLPVVHHNEDFKWLEKYIVEGYKYICIGGVAKTKGYSQTKRFHDWGDKAFRIICPASNKHLPLVKVHGFAITSIPLIRRYPWYSVDSVTWKKMSYYGQILVPPRSAGEWDLSTNPLVVFMDSESKYTKRDRDTGRHFLSFAAAEQAQIKAWLKHIRVPFGKRGVDGSIINMGVTNEDHYRCQANIRYFEVMKKTLPKWPWPFNTHHRPTLMEVLNG